MIENIDQRCQSASAPAASIQNRPPNVSVTTTPSAVATLSPFSVIGTTYQSFE
ncbi:MAG: hypothetical protein E6J42_09575 [Chloroflexi bacterium]|nr:MAG: hypothetical protein E6J42_09575 [Chloroflexota bacterium]